MKFRYTLILFLWYSASRAQLNIEWQNCLGGTNTDNAYWIQQTSDGGYIVAGETLSNDGDVSGNHGNYDYWVIKLNSTGTLQWQKCLGGTSQDQAFSIRQTSDGGYIAVGQCFSNDGDVSGNHQPGTNPYDNWIVKLDGSGSISWSRCNGGFDWEDGRDVTETTDGGFVAATDGAWSPDNGDVSGKRGASDFWLTKQNSAGTLVWQKCLGGTGQDYSYSIQQTSDGGYVTTGRSTSNDVDVSGNHGGWDGWVVKIDSATRTVQWQRCLGGTGTDRPVIVRQTSDGGYIVAGRTDSNDGDVSGNHGGNDMWVVKLNSTGTLIWQKCLGGSGSDHAAGLQQTSDGGYIIVGRTNSNDGDVSGNHGGNDVWVVKLDASGNIQAKKCFGGTGDDQAESIQETSDGGYILAGRTASNDGDASGNNGSTDFWIVKLNVWNLPVELLNFDVIPDTDKAHVYWSTASETNNDYYTIERSTDAKSFEQIYTVKGAGTTSTLKDYYSIDHSPPEGLSYYRLKQTDYDGKYTYSKIIPVTFGSANKFDIGVYPNPFNTQTGKNIVMNITGIQSDNSVLVVLYDIHGKEFYSKIVINDQDSSARFILQNTEVLAKGIYFISASSNNNYVYHKLVVE